eukprot:CCRYP_015176-RA/>CCRYP_015176-RA protein AED:0.12 eAED:0.12 QI:0/-1/0/1/-1/1/1/0/553
MEENSTQNNTGDNNGGPPSFVGLAKPPSTDESDQMKKETDGGQSTASQDETRSFISCHVLKVLDLKFPRCSTCSLDWYSYDADDEECDDGKEKESITEDCCSIPDGDKKPSTSGLFSSPTPREKPKRIRPSHTKLYPLPQCQCFSKMAMPPSHETGSLLFSADSATEQSPHDILSNIQIHEFPNLAMCKPCLEKKIATSNEVLEYDYRQDHIENGQRSIKYSIEPKCDQCKQKFSKRSGLDPEKLKTKGHEAIVTGGKKKSKSKKEWNWFDSVDATIQLVGWMKRQKRMGVQEQQRSKNNVPLGTDRSYSKGWWAKYGCSNYDDGYGSSDACYSFSSGSESDFDTRKPKGPPRQIARDGELHQMYKEKMDELRKEELEREKRDHELAMKLDAEAATRKADLEREERDCEIAKILDAKLNAQELADKKKKEEEDRKCAERLFAELNKESVATGSSIKTLKTPSPTDRKRKTDSKKGTPSSCKQLKIARSDPSIATSYSVGGIKINSESLSILVEMGYTTAAAERCLISAEGNLNVAASMLLSEASDCSHMDQRK